MTFRAAAPWILPLVIFACHQPPAQSPTPVSSVRIISSDIPNFWRAYDLGAGKDSADRVRLFQTAYLRPGSPGLHDWIRARLMNRDTVLARLVASGRTADEARAALRRDTLEADVERLVHQSAGEQLVRAIGRYPRYYAAVRAATLAVDTSTAVTGEIRRGLNRLAELIPGARFPTIYFLIGTTSSGGTVGRSGMLIGTEQQSSDSSTPVDELPEWLRATSRLNSPATMARLVIHEAVHTQQAPRPAGQKNTLLRQALVEGGADFITELALGPAKSKSPREEYGEAHEHAVWLDFRDEMATDSTITTWMYNGRVAEDKRHGAVDIGYWVGYRIARAYYERAQDKQAAVRELLLLEDSERLLSESGYAAYAESLQTSVR